MSGSIFSIGLSGLNAARLALSTTSHNIANAATPGYSRQEIVQSEAMPQSSGAGFIGSGVEVDTVKRLYNQFLETQRLNAQTQQSYLDAYHTQAAQIDNMLADPTSGLSPSLQSFFSGLADVSSNPASVPSRQSLLSGAEAMDSRFAALQTRFEDLRSGVASQIGSTVDHINTLAQAIADVSGQMVAVASSDEKPANDLFDQRGQLVSELNKLVRVTTVTQGDGTFNVFVGSGQSLVVGRNVMTLSASPSADDPSSTSVNLQVGAISVPMPPEVFQGGELGGLLAFRDGMLNDAQNAFGRVALALAMTFNDQHRLGQDLQGSLGGDFFVEPAPVIHSRTTNTGDGVLSATISDVTAVTASDYRLTYSGGNYTITRLSDDQRGTYATLPQTVDGIDIDIASGTILDGDGYLIQPTRYAARDIAVAIKDTNLVAAAAPVRTGAATTNTGNGKITAGVVSDVTAMPLPGTVTLTYTQATNEFAVTGSASSPGPFAYTSGASIAFDGMSLAISGTPADGDTFTITNNTAGVADNRNALLLGRLQTTNIINGGSANYQAAFSQVVSNVGNATREIQVQLEAQDTLTRQTVEAEQSFSGVNLDEEAAQLIRNQQAYQASAKVLQIASSLFQSVLELG